MQLADAVAQIELLNKNSTGANFRCTACILQHTEVQTKIRGSGGQGTHYMFILFELCQEDIFEICQKSQFVLIKCRKL